MSSLLIWSMGRSWRVVGGLAIASAVLALVALVVLDGFDWRPPLLTVWFLLARAIGRRLLTAVAEVLTQP